MKFVRIVCFFIAAISCIRGYGQVTFVIDQLPKSTPAEDTIFIAGTFNNWELNDPSLMLNKRLDGKYFITIPAGRGTIEYKFHRGSWMKCETDASNNYKPNRTFTYGNGTVVPIIIENWQDAGGARSFDLLIFYFFTVALLCAAIILFLYRLKGRQKKQSKVIIGFLGFVCVILIGRVLYEISPLVWQLKLQMIGDLLLLLSGPIWFGMVFSEQLSPRSVYMQITPVAIVSIIVLMKLMNSPVLSGLTTPLATPLFTIDQLLFYGAGLISQLVYLGLAFINFHTKEQSSSLSELIFVKHLLWAEVGFTIVFTGKLIVLFYGDKNLLLLYNEDVLFLAASVFPIMLGYYVFRHEEIFKSSGSVKIPDAEKFMNRVHEVMLEKKCFCDPNLTLNQLSEIVNIRPHLLSRIINECCHQNFRDFVNKYRVEEFVKLARQQTNHKYTFLALANDVGFNSKSTFNVAFKKVLQQSPREFLKANRILDHFTKDEERLVL